LYFSRGLFVYSSSPVHICIRAFGPQMNINAIHNMVSQPVFRVRFVFLSLDDFVHLFLCPRCRFFSRGRRTLRWPLGAAPAAAASSSLFWIIFCCRRFFDWIDCRRRDCIDCRRCDSIGCRRWVSPLLTPWSPAPTSSWSGSAHDSSAVLCF
jgi:hypothetical protein